VDGHTNRFGVAPLDGFNIGPLVCQYGKKALLSVFRLVFFSWPCSRKLPILNLCCVYVESVLSWACCASPIGLLIGLFLPNSLTSPEDDHLAALAPSATACCCWTSMFVNPYSLSLWPHGWLRYVCCFTSLWPVGRRFKSTVLSLSLFWWFKPHFSKKSPCWWFAKLAISGCCRLPYLSTCV